MEKVFAKAEELAENVKDYFDTRLEAVKLNVAEKTSLVAANAAAGLVVLVVMTFFFFLMATGFALLIGDWIGKTWAGFLIMAGVCLILAMLIWVARRKLIQLPIMNALIKQLFTDEDEDNEED